MTKILHTIPALDGGGADRVIFDYCIRMMPELNFDFIVHSEHTGILETELLNKGCNIFHIPPIKKNFLKYIQSVIKIYKENQYDILHVSQGFWGFLFIFIGYLFGIKVRIAHAHMANVPESKLQTIKRFIFSKLTIVFSTDLFACGKDAAIWMWGLKKYNRNEIVIMENAIDGEKFAFNQKKREILRREWNLETNLVIGNIGRITHQKNQTFLIDIFKEVLKLVPNSTLILIGRGELESELREKVHQLGIADAVIFTGIRTDVHDLLNLMDVFVLPSYYEGLPITLLEVQMNGLPTVVSNNITSESRFTDNYYSISLDEDSRIWAQQVLEIANKRRTINNELQIKRDVDYLAPIQKKWYQKRVEK